MKKRSRLLVVLLLLGFAGLLLYPTINWYFMFSQEQRDLAMGSKDMVREYVEDISNQQQKEFIELFNANPNAALPSELSFLKDTATEWYEAQEDFNTPSEWTVEAVRASYPNTLSRFERRLADDLRAHHLNRVEELKEVQKNIILRGLDLAGGINIVLEADLEGFRQAEAAKDDESSSNNFSDQELMQLTVQSLRDRIDNFGLVEPQIRLLEGNLINVQIPGEFDDSKILALLMGQNALSFHSVDVDAQLLLDDYVRENPNFHPEDAAYDISHILRAGLEVIEFVEPDRYGYDQHVKWMIIESAPGIRGEDVEKASVSQDGQTGRPQVQFTLSSDGAAKFGPFTARLVESRLQDDGTFLNNQAPAIAGVFTGKLKFHATVKEALYQPNLRVTGFNIEEARYISQILASASLKVNLSVVSHEEVGSTLGDAAIEIGLNAILLGLILVVVFMVLYYKGAGLIASVALALNLLFIIAALSAFNLTLTLTSIAGLVLTVGMAVDANVIVFERIKEEYRLGKSARASVIAGYEKALSTIIDANITTFIAALFLSLLGTGPVQGFAITLAVGVMCSMLTAIFITRFMFDFGLDTFKSEKLSITWERR